MIVFLKNRKRNCIPLSNNLGSKLVCYLDYNICVWKYLIKFKNLSESEINIDLKKSIKIISYLKHLKYQHIVLFKWITMAKYVGRNYIWYDQFFFNFFHIIIFCIHFLLLLILMKYKLFCYIVHSMNQIIKYK